MTFGSKAKVTINMTFGMGFVSRNDFANSNPNCRCLGMSRRCSRLPNQKI
jgi:hypothetical protein